MKLYHFCAMSQGESAGCLSYTGGTLKSDADFSDAEQYTKLKRQIIEYINSNGGNVTEIALLSLTLLGEVTPNAKVVGLDASAACGESHTNAGLAGTDNERNER